MFSFLTGPVQAVLKVIDSSFGASGRKRILLLIACLFGTIVCFVVIRCWTYVPIYTHMIMVDHPFSSDTSSCHFVTADVEIKMYDGYLVYGNQDETHKMTRSCVFRYKNRPKNPDVKKPSLPTIDDVNYYVQTNVLSKDGDEKSLALDEIGNVGVFCHTFNTGGEMLLTQGPYDDDYNSYVDEFGIRHNRLLAHAFNDDWVLNCPAYNYLKQRLPTFFYDERSGHFVHSYACVVSDKTDSITSIGHSIDKDPITMWDKISYHSQQFVKLQDISRCCYNVYVVTRGVDSIKVKAYLYEDADIVSDNQKTGSNYAESVYSGETDKNVCVFSFNAKLLESENTQMVRLFFITTLCAGFFGLFLKYLVQILLSIKFFSKR